MEINVPIKVAYAEDHDLIRQGIRDLLTNSGQCQFVIEASNGKELLEKLKSAAQLPDLCILDIYMPQMNGYDALVELRKRWPDLKVLVLTGHNTEYYLIKMIRAGANGYMLKSSSLSELERALLSVHQHGHFYSDAISQKFVRMVSRGELTVPEISDKEADILRYCCTDMSYVQIAEKMGITPKSVEHWRESLFKKLKVSSRSGLVMFAVQFGLVEIHNNTIVTP